MKNFVNIFLFMVCLSLGLVVVNQNTVLQEKNIKITTLQTQLQDIKKAEHQYINFFKKAIEIKNSQINITQNKYRKILIKLKEIQDWRKTLRIIGRREVLVTAYNAHVDQCDDTPFTTATMTYPKPGKVAVSRDLYKKGWHYGRKVSIKGKIYTIEDLMGPNERNKIDIFMHSEKDALNWGVQKLEITLLEEKDTTKSTFVAFNK